MMIRTKERSSETFLSTQQKTRNSPLPGETSSGTSSAASDAKSRPSSSSTLTASTQVPGFQQHSRQNTANRPDKSISAATTSTWRPNGMASTSTAVSKQQQNFCSDRARPSRERSFAETMDELRKCVWYWGPVSWQEAERVLKDRPNGSFILRDSTSDRYIFSLSCKTRNSVIHARIPQHRGKFCYGGPRSLLNSESILEFILETIQRSEDGKLHFFVHPKNSEDQAENIRLLFPLSRNSVLPSLKHLCRFQILRRIRPDHIDSLTLPPFLKNYLKNPNYIAEVPPK